MNKTTISLLVTACLGLLQACGQGASVNDRENAAWKVTPVQPIQLNDTGVNYALSPQSYPSWTAPQTVNPKTSPLPGQDAEHGRDASQVPSTTKGFQFSKYQNIRDGNVTVGSMSVAADDSEWDCVHDEVTGLWWEAKKQVDPLHKYELKYTWYQPDASQNGGDAGDPRGFYCTGAGVSYTRDGGNTHDFVRKVNQQKLCGFSDWRLPTVEEARSIVDFSKSINLRQTSFSEPVVDTQFFPYLGLSLHWWTSQTLVNESRRAWAFHYTDGTTHHHDKYCSSDSAENAIMVVRGP